MLMFMCADRAASYCKSAGNFPERSVEPKLEKFLAITKWKKFRATMEKLTVSMVRRLGHNHGTARQC
jgi:hypothetical protein